MLLPYYKRGVLECGCDEAGRGCLAGPVFAAAVILPPDFVCPDLDDSKKLDEKTRNRLRPIIENNAVAWAVAKCDADSIDEYNILYCSLLAMNKAIRNLKVKPEFLLIDGNRFRNSTDIPFQCVVKGDGKYMSIAAASILAKTHRDEYMSELHEKFPMYGWDKNKGYPTAAHRKAIAEYGACKEHRKTFRLLV